MIDLIIKSYKTNLKANSLKIYVTSLRKLNDGNVLCSLNDRTGGPHARTGRAVIVLNIVID